MERRRGIGRVRRGGEGGGSGEVMVTESIPRRRSCKVKMARRGEGGNVFLEESLY